MAIIPIIAMGRIKKDARTAADISFTSAGFAFLFIMAFVM
jgi:hypothetical protein